MKKRLLGIGQTGDINTMIYGVTNGENILEEILLKTNAPLSPSELVKLCRDNDCKISLPNFYTHMAWYVQHMYNGMFIFGTRECTNALVAMMSDEEYAGMLDSLLDSDNYPMTDDLIAIIDADSVLES